VLIQSTVTENMSQFGDRDNSRFVLRLVQIVLAFSLIGTASAAVAQEFVPPDRGMPGRRESGGTRGGCLPNQTTLMALMPNSNISQTVSGYPTFFWYVPATTAEVAEFVLLDSNDREIYTTTFALDHQAGIIQLSLPDATLPPLTIGTEYQWYFSLICDMQDRSGDVFTSGWIQRIAPNPALTRQLEQVAENDRAKVYAEAGIWQDALMHLATLRTAQPNNAEIAQQWETLLESVDLEDLVTQPMLPCCQEP
jgi:hypothetical protein